jgi:hypothetical protein
MSRPPTRGGDEPHLPQTSPTGGPPSDVPERCAAKRRADLGGGSPRGAPGAGDGNRSGTVRHERRRAPGEPARTPRRPKLLGTVSRRTVSRRTVSRRTASRRTVPRPVARALASGARTARPARPRSGRAFRRRGATTASRLACGGATAANRLAEAVAHVRVVSRQRCPRRFSSADASRRAAVRGNPRRAKRPPHRGADREAGAATPVTGAPRASPPTTGRSIRVCGWRAGGSPRRSGQEERLGSPHPRRAARAAVTVPSRGSLPPCEDPFVSIVAPGGGTFPDSRIGSHRVPAMHPRARFPSPRTASRPRTAEHHDPHAGTTQW